MKGFAGTGNCTDYSGKKARKLGRHMMTGQTRSILFREGEAGIFQEF